MRREIRNKSKSIDKGERYFRSKQGSSKVSESGQAMRAQSRAQNGCQILSMSKGPIYKYAGVHPQLPMFFKSVLAGMKIVQLALTDS